MCAVLKIAFLQLSDTQHCKDTSSAFSFETNGAFGEDLFCADDQTGGHTGPCNGDSGGPVVKYKTSEFRFVLEGIVQGGGGCAVYDAPDVFTSTNFAPIYEWIVRKVNACTNSLLDCTNGELVGVSLDYRYVSHCIA